MKKKAIETKKLQLNRETLSALEETVLDVAQGAVTCNTRLTCSSNLC